MRTGNGVVVRRARCVGVLRRRPLSSCRRGKQWSQGDEILEFHPFEARIHTSHTQSLHTAARTPIQDPDALPCLCQTLLKPPPFQADESKILQEPLTRTVAEFLRRRASDQPADALETACVSLSGGVDSMVLCRILVRLGAARSAGAPKRVVALHIDYGNRPESAAEAEYVRQWCEVEVGVGVLSHISILRGVHRHRPQKQKGGCL